jgi:hypothetical protein
MRRYALSIFLLVLLCGILAVPSIEASLTWDTQQVKEYVWAGGDCPIAIDQSGNTHIAYLDGYTLIYATYDGQEWTNQTIATNAIYLIFSLVIDSNGNPHLLYEKKLEGPLKIADWNGEAWTTQDTGVAYTDFAALAVDSLGNPSIVYTTFTTNINHEDWSKNTVNTSLNYAKWTGTNWDTQIVDTVMYDSLSSISFTLTNSNVPYILYSPSSNLNSIKLATTENSKWKIQEAELPPSTGNCGNIAVDSKGYAHFLCTQPYQNSTSLRTILYATFNLSTWNTQTITSGIDVGTVANLVLDSQDNPHFTFSIYEGDSMYVTYSANKWQNITLPSGVVAGNLALDSSGNLHLLYRTEAPARFSSHLMYAFATAEITSSTMSNAQDNTVLEATISAVLVLAVIVTATIWQRNHVKSKRANNA